MTYKERLHPWCIVRHRVNDLQPEVLHRFRRHNDAEHHLQALKRLSRSGTFAIVFDAKENLGAESIATSAL
ncbi:hypothetical protein Pse7367_3336 [Thalassoporum mexicanum PCC 7367]|uniref:hypothetical protein n=1 Tax=Thalassoporum mexicanum TaxID=3457544 RepID=UPI00029FB4E3|nr:hypothetical protein [Pseudanabaena sp. PCC 7367]AFY71576.1 hypothetical protein Pse7367_3336 [Pseudanabaena sp. PCC 7367]